MQHKILRLLFTHRNRLILAAAAQALAILTLTAIYGRDSAWAWFLAILLGGSATYLFALNWKMAEQVNRSFTALLANAGSLDNTSGAVVSAGQSLQSAGNNQIQHVLRTKDQARELEARNARQSTQSERIDGLVRKFTSDLEQCREALGQMKENLTQVRSTSRQGTHVVRGLEQLAVHTRILSLNASIQAAHAGEAGVGFGVVAENVRSLADEADKAAVQSSSLIESNAAQAQKGLKLLEDADGTIQALFELTDQAMESVNSTTAAQLRQTRDLASLIQQVGVVEKQSEVVANAATECAQVTSRVTTVAEGLRQTIGSLPGFLPYHVQPDADASVSDEIWREFLQPAVALTVAFLANTKLRLLNAYYVITRKPSREPIHSADLPKQAIAGSTLD